MRAMVCRSRGVVDAALHSAGLFCANCRIASRSASVRCSGSSARARCCSSRSACSAESAHSQSRSSVRATKRLSGSTARSEEHTSELQSLMRISYAVFCLKKKKPHKKEHTRDAKHDQKHQYEL